MGPLALLGAAPSRWVAALPLDPDFSVRLTATLGHFVWQGLAVALLVALARPMLRRASGQVRYASLCGALALMAVCPVVTFALYGGATTDDSAASESPSLSVARSVASNPTVPLPEPADEDGTSETLASGDVTGDTAVPTPGDARVSDSSKHVGDDDDIAPADVAPAVPAQGGPVDAGSTVDASSAGPAFEARDWGAYAPYASAAYLLGVGFMVARLLVGLYAGQRLSRSCEPIQDPELLQAIARQAKAIGLSFIPAVALCTRVTVPAVVGVLRPMLLLPAALATGLSIEQVEVLVAHELAHIRRYDHVVNLVQRVIESFLFFHPGVWYVSGLVRLERECCCDDRVVASGRAPLAYADLLLRVAELQARGGRDDATPAAGPAVGTLALAATGDRPSQLKRRILRLVEGHRRGGPRVREDLRLNRKGTAFVGAVVLVGLLAPLYFGALGRTVIDEDALRLRDPDLASLTEELRADPKKANQLVNGDWTRLHEAVLYKGKAEIDILLKFGADPNAKAAKGWTPLHMAAYYGRVDVAELLLLNGADVEAKARYERTPLHVAAGLDKPFNYPGAKVPGRDMVALLLAHGARIDARDKQGLTPLHAAVSRRDIGTLRYLIETGADKDAADEHGWTPLHLAVLNPPDAGVTLALVDSGVNVNAKDPEGWTPLDYLVGRDRVVTQPMRVIASRLMARGAEPNLFASVGLDMLDRAKEILDQDPDAIHYRPRAIGTVGGWTALHLAARHGTPEMIRFLLSRGADPALRNHQGVTPLQGALDRASANVVEALLAGEQRDGVVPSATSTLYHAVLKGRADLIPTLVSRGASVSERGPGGRTALHVAASQPNPSRAVVAALLESGADRSARDDAGRTPRELARSATGPEILDLLELPADAVE